MEDVGMFFSKKWNRVVALCLSVLMMTQWGGFNYIHGNSNEGNERFYPIYNVDDLRAIQDNLSGSYILLNDIDLSEVENWIPIRWAFSGEFNGNGHVIENMTSRDTNSNVGLFEVISDATIYDLGFKNVTLETDGKNCTGALAEEVVRSTIKNIYVTGKGTANVFGIAGSTEESKFENCYVSLEGTGKAGGVIGGKSGWFDNSKLTNSYYNKDVTKLMSLILGTPKKAKDLKHASTFKKWDFTHVWKIEEGKSFPTFQTDREPLFLSGKASGNIKSEELHIEFVYSEPIKLGSGNIYVYKKNGDELVGTYKVSAESESISVSDNRLNLDINIPIEGNQDYYILADEGIVTSLMGKKVQALTESTDIAFREFYIENGSGTAENPYLIYTVEALERVREGLGYHYRLMNDLDLSGIAHFEPIGSYETRIPFTGSFDGNGYRIYGLTQKHIGGVKDSGLFGYSQGDIMNLGVVNVDLSRDMTEKYVGGLVGYNDGDVTNCYLRGNVEGGGTESTMLESLNRDHYVGGLVGYNEGVVTDCYSEGSVKGKAHIGGLVGYNKGDITNGYTTGSVEGDYYVGGLVGYNEGNVTGTYTTGSVEGNLNIGGLVGYNEGNVINTYTTGGVKGGDYVGGSVGYNDGGVTNSYTLGNVSGDYYVGGLIGENEGDVKTCYSTGGVNGNEYVGGLIGIQKEGTLEYGYYDSERSGQEDTEKGELKTTAAIQEKETFEGFDFEEIWSINEGRTTPYLTKLVPKSLPVVGNEIPTVDSDIMVIEDTPKEGTLNVVDLDGDCVTVRVVETTSGGALTVDHAGDYTYIPEKNVTGTDQFVVELKDGYSTTEATVMIYIQEVDDLPMAIGDDIDVDEDCAITGVLPIYDIDGGTVKYGIDKHPKHGNVSIQAETGAFLY